MKNIIFIPLYLLSLIGHAQMAITRGDTLKKNIALVFTGDEFGDGGFFIDSVLHKARTKASFFLTGNFYRNTTFQPVIQNLISHGHYLGSHSDKHLLYCDWSKRDSLLVSRDEFVIDLENSYKELKRFGVKPNESIYFLPPYEWFNDSIVTWTHRAGLQMVNFTPGTLSHADYTYPEMGARYTDSKTILKSIIDYEQKVAGGLNGFILLVHIGTDPRRTDKFYFLLPQLLSKLKTRGYRFLRIDELLQ